MDQCIGAGSKKVMPAVRLSRSEEKVVEIVNYNTDGIMVALQLLSFEKIDT